MSVAKILKFIDLSSFFYGLYRPSAWLIYLNKYANAEFI